MPPDDIALEVNDSRAMGISKAAAVLAGSGCLCVLFKPSRLSNVIEIGSRIGLLETRALRSQQESRSDEGEIPWKDIPRGFQSGNAQGMRQQDFVGIERTERPWGYQEQAKMIEEAFASMARTRILKTEPYLSNEPGQIFIGLVLERRTPRAARRLRRVPLSSRPPFASTSTPLLETLEHFLSGNAGDYRWKANSCRIPAIRPDVLSWTRPGLRQ